MTGSKEENELLKTDMVRRMSRDQRMSIIETHDNEMKGAKRRLHCCPCYIPKRLVMVFLCFLGMFALHAMRVNVAVAVVTLMDENVHVKVGTPKAVSNRTHHFRPQLPDREILQTDVKWDARSIGFLHSIFYIGFLITQIPGGFLVQKIPSHRVFGASILLSCVLNLLVPVAIADVGYAFTCVVRFAQGLSEGLCFPACYNILSNWTLGPQQSKMASFVITGVYAGAIFGFPISGFLTHYVGWQYVFFVNGAIGIIWFLFWIYLAYEKPEHHPYISHKELEFILASQGESEDNDQNSKSEKVPWAEILTSVPVLALCVCHFSRSWMFFLLLTNEPAYINAFGYSLAANGLLASIPHVAMVIVSAVSGPLADFLIGNPLLSTTDVRKIFTCMGFGVEAVCCFILTFVDVGEMAIVFLSIGVGFSGLTTSGWQINHLDIAPRYAGLLIGITTSVGTVGGIISPLICGIITFDQSLHSWQMAWLLTAGVLAIGVLFYGIFASGERQTWASPKRLAEAQANKAGLLSKAIAEESETTDTDGEPTDKPEQSDNIDSANEETATETTTDRTAETTTERTTGKTNSEHKPLTNSNGATKSYGSNEDH